MSGMTVILSAYNERKNLEILLPSLIKVLKTYDLDYEIIVIDDASTDDTFSFVKQNFSNDVRVFRLAKRYDLAYALIYGILLATKDYVVIMDADNQHPPEFVPIIYRYLKSGYDIVIASRYLKKSIIQDWDLSRYILSRLAILLVHLLIPPTRHIKDPLSGFFGLKKSLIFKVKSMYGRGYKVLLDFLVKLRDAKVIEIPFIFRRRLFGKSKITFKTIVYLIRHTFYLAYYARKG